MNKPMSDFHFKLMSSIGIKIRNLFLSPAKIIKEVKIESGFQVLDFGCGAGYFTLMAAEIVGESGKVYALDIHPLASKIVEKRANKKKLANVKTILSDCQTGLPDNTMDVILFYDTFHLLNEPDKVLVELHRVLKPNGILSFSDHHMKEDEIISKVTNRELFRLSRKGKRTYSLLKEEPKK